MQKWLVPTDGSTSALNAATWAARMSKLVQGGVEITLLAVVEDVTMNLMMADPEATVVQPSLLESMMQQADEAAQAALNRTLAAVEAEGATAVTRLERGSPRQLICNVAAEGSFDLVAMGSRGLGGLAELVLGSVSHYVVQHSSTPVLIVR